MRHPGRALLVLLALPDAPLSRRLPLLLSLLLLLLLLLLLAQTRRHTLRVQRCVHFLCLALPLLPSRHWARIPRVCIGSSGRCWPHALGINRLFFTHARRDLAPTSARLACAQLPSHLPAATPRLRSPSSSALPPHELSSCSRARAHLRLTSVD